MAIIVLKKKKKKEKKIDWQTVLLDLVFKLLFPFLNLFFIRIVAAVYSC